MTKPTESKFMLFAGASALAMSIFTPAAVAQDDPAPADDSRRLETVTVTTQKTSESIQDVPIAVSAFDESAIDRLQLTGGPDLVKAIPNVAFTKGNFAGYNFKIRGIGADVVAQSGDAGVGIHQNDVPLTANNLFEAEFFDVERVEVLRGPQGTLYGRNATGGVFNLITAKPVLGEFLGNVEAQYGNYASTKIKGMVNIPLGDMAALRVAGSYLTRDGYAENAVTGTDIDGRDLYGIRATLALEPTENSRFWFSYDHFKEDDNRLRAGKQLCKKDVGDTTFNGVAISPLDRLATSQGCLDVPLDQMDGRVNSSATLGGGLAITAGLLSGDAFTAPVIADLRTIESAFDPIYQAEQNLYTFKGEVDLTDSVTATYIGSYGDTTGTSIEDYNKIAPTLAFNAVAGPFAAVPALYPLLFPGGVVNDPQLGSSNLFRTFDQSGGETSQTTHELRLQSDFDGTFNFNIGGILVDYEEVDETKQPNGYYVYSNSLTALTQINNAAGGAFFGGQVPLDTAGTQPSLFNGDLSGLGGNYFRSLSPYKLKSSALFGETYYEPTDALKFTLGLRYTNDEKEQKNIPTFLFTPQAAGANPVAPRLIAGNAADAAGDGTYNAQFEEVTGRIGFDWSPDVGFSEDTLIYGFYSKGYKGGGINPPQPAGANFFPQFFEPEFINSFEVGTKNTVAGGAAQINATAFMYDYKGYQITQIINRTSANLNIDSELKGIELETLWTPSENLLLTANLGLLDAKVVDTFAIDTINRTAGRTDMVVLKNASSFANCVVSAQGYQALLTAIATPGSGVAAGTTRGICGFTAAQRTGLETALGLTGRTISYTGVDGTTRTASLLSAIDGEAQDLDGNSMPLAPELTLNLAAEYTFPAALGQNWDLTVRGDYYLQGESQSRIFNSPRDGLDSWSNINLAVQLNNEESGWGIEAFAKNITDEEVITGSYLTDDSSGLFTNIFLTEPALYGVSVKKSW